MKVELLHGANYDGCSTLEIAVDGKDEVYAYPLYECPEDAMLGRSLSYAYKFVPLMRRAYEAGVRGEPFTVIETDEKE